MLGETQNQFSLTRATLSTSALAKNKFLSVNKIMKRSVPLLVVFLALTSSILTAPGQNPKLPEPDTIGAVYFFDPAKNSLVELEKQITASQKHGWPKQKIVAVMKGEKAPLRFKSNQPMEFVVSLANGVDPSKFQLVAFTPKAGNREATIKEATWTGSKINPIFQPFKISKFGSAYKFTPSPALPPGEYAFSANDSQDAFAFGVDEAGNSEKK
jgi:hypothetical protein